jgi:hypothetical protein
MKYWVLVEASDKLPFKESSQFTTDRLLSAAASLHKCTSTYSNLPDKYAPTNFGLHAYLSGTHTLEN